ILLSVILAFGFFNEFVHTPFRSLLNYFQYFMAGFLALDFYLDKKQQKSHWYDLICFMVMFIMYTGIVRYGVLLPFLIFFLLWLSPLSIWWERLLSLKWITIIGGMCYSIYMLHHPLMALFLNRITGNEMIGGNLWLDFGIKLIAVLALVFLCSTAYFVLVERPCMKKDWYKKFLPLKYR
ncbi:MAG: hypothetical protein JNL60_10705, partial [Bacteroidia bacterium]|nr:hypothetical protein [Bacteroidia bacterium]